MKRSRLTVLAVMCAVTASLFGCSSSPEPKETSAPAPVIEKPDYVDSGIPFTVNGNGNQNITINFPAGFDEPSIVTLSSNGKTVVYELDYDNNKVGSAMLSTRDGGGEVTIVKYPTTNTPSRTNKFSVESDGAWAISAEGLSNVSRLNELSMHGINSTAFMVNVKADFVSFVTNGTGQTKVAFIDINAKEPRMLSGGKDKQSAFYSAKELGVDNLYGYIFLVTTDGNEDQEWELLFSNMPDN